MEYRGKPLTMKSKTLTENRVSNTERAESLSELQLTGDAFPNRKLTGGEKTLT